MADLSSFIQDANQEDGLIQSDETIENGVVENENVDNSVVKNGVVENNFTENGFLFVPYIPQNIYDLDSLLSKIQKCALATDSWKRQMVGRRFVEFLREQTASGVTTSFIEDIPHIMSIFIQLIFFDTAPIVSTELVEHLPQIAMAFMELNDETMANVVPKYILPMIVECYGNADPQVRTSSRTATLLLVEHNIVSKNLIKLKVCPKIMELSYKPHEDFVSNAIILMAKFSRFLGKYFTEGFFLPRYIQLCSYDKFSVRRIAAASMGEFCAVVGPEAFEKILLPKFVELCKDGIWNVRKHCAEVIVAVSCLCPPHLRKTVLSPAFELLLDDQSRWVQLSACQSLGPFISTFANPRITDLQYNQNGELVIVDSNSSVLSDNIINTNENEEDSEEERILLEEVWSIVEVETEEQLGEFQLHKRRKNLEKFSSCIKEWSNITNTFSDLDLNSDNIENIVNNNNNNNNLEDKKVLNTDFTPLDGIGGADDIDKFNSHMFWSVPIPDITTNDLDLLQNCKNKNNNIQEDYSFKPHPIKRGPFWSVNGDVPTIYQKPQPERIPSQSIVPDLLIERFKSMADPAQVEQIDPELCYHCAYSFPAVAVTLGKENWHLIAPTYYSLSGELHWKVRLAVAGSLHEIAQILGEELATQYLAPIFEDFIKDVDQVRIGVLKNMTQFFKLISPERRNTYLSRMPEFLQTDTMYNWRFRCELSSQLLESIQFWPPAEVARFIMPVAMDLLDDRVAAVRSSAILLVSELVRVEVVSSPNKKNINSIYEIVNLAHSKGWQRRQIFVTLCGYLVHALPPEIFGREIMPHFLDLTWDRVPNVRLVVARVICQNILNHEFYADPHCFHENSLVIVLKRLQSDPDRDVREAAFKTFVNLGKT